MSTYAVILPTEKIKLFAEQLPTEYSASAVYINGIFFLMLFIFYILFSKFAMFFIILFKIMLFS